MVQIGGILYKIIATMVEFTKMYEYFLGSEERGARSVYTTLPCSAPFHRALLLFLRPARNRGAVLRVRAHPKTAQSAQ